MTLFTTPNLSGVGSLSTILDELEKNITKLDLKMGIQPLELLKQMDMAQARIDELQAKNQDIQRDVERFNELGRTLRKRAKAFLRRLDAGTLQTARAEHQPPAEAWWWYLDRWQKEQTRKTIRRYLIRGGIIIGVLAILVVVYQLFLAPDAATQATLDHQFNASQALQLQDPDYATALKEVTAALQYSPDDLNMQTLQGVLQEKLGQTEQAAQTLKAAESTAPSQEEYLISVCSSYFQIYEYDKSIDYANQAIAVNADSAEAYMYLAQAYYGKGDNSEAYQTYEKAAELAQKDNNIEMVALIRVRLAYLTQEMGMPSGN